MFPSDILTIASKLVKITNEQTITLSTAESCTGGLIAGAITEIPGSSSIFHRGYVTYSNLAKQQVLNVQSYQLKKLAKILLDPYITGMIEMFCYLIFLQPPTVLLHG